jgi:hypothetical protein
MRIQDGEREKIVKDKDSLAEWFSSKLAIFTLQNYLTSLLEMLLVANDVIKVITKYLIYQSNT